ncbi:myb/sant-like dna-binding domain [Holotrichia oblita]|uniref:Myb/sant-like dna-binding domain n=1 Tax=Holotrichia oblita TaxID=644536 RepID=A0ACB9SJL0_HOLOL|nr:myb/sant-like dna-binding domain [Holotrichia oblita]
MQENKYFPEKVLQEFLLRPSGSEEIAGSTQNEYIIWSHNNTKLLTDLYGKYRNKVGTLELRSLKKMWELIATEINKIANSKFFATNVENRWRVSERNYKKTVENNNKSGRGRKNFEYMQEMDEIFERKKNIYPEILLSSDTPVNLPSTSTGNVNEIDITQDENDNQSTAESGNLMKTVVKQNKNTNERRSKQYRRNTLEDIRQDRLKHQTAILQLQTNVAEKKLKLHGRLLEEKTRKNDLIEERNRILKEFIIHKLEIPDIFR